MPTIEEGSSRAHVAVVDDDESVCRSLARLLRASEVAPCTYSSAEAFLDDPSRDRFDCLIVDVQLGGMSGLELQESLAVSGSSTPVIFITAYDESGVREHAMKSGCAAYLRKSDTAEVVLAALSRAIRGDDRKVAAAGGGCRQAEAAHGKFGP